jgi:phage-related protein
LIEDKRGNAYRTVYTVRTANSVHVLLAFQKKSKSGIATPKSDVDLVERRLNAVLGRRSRERS